MSFSARFFAFKGGVHDCFVLKPDVAGRFGLAQDVTHDPAQKAPMRFGCGRQQWVSASFVEQPMQRLVLADHLRHIAFGHGACCRPPVWCGPVVEGLAGGFILCQAPGTVARCEPVQQGAHLVVVVHEINIQMRDTQTPLSHLFHQPVGFQQCHRLLHWLARNAKTCGEFLLFEMSARRQSSAADLVKYRFVDLFGKSRCCLDRIILLNTEF